MSRILTLVGGVVAVGLAFATADWEPVAVAHTGDHNRRGRTEFRHAAVAPAADDAAEETPVAEAPEEPAGGAAVDIPVEPETPMQPDPEPEPEPELDIVTIRDVELAVVDSCELPMFPVNLAVQLQIDSEGLMFWVTSSKRIELDSQKQVFRNIGSADNRDRELLVVPDKFTPWQYVKDTLATADKASTPEVYLGVAGEENTTTLRLLRVMTSDPSDEAREGDFVVRVSDGDDGPAVVADGVEVEMFPADLAQAWNDWRKENADADVSLGPNTRVVVDAHRFTPAGQVAQVVGVLRGLGIEAERFVGSTSYGGRKRK